MQFKRSSNEGSAMTQALTAQGPAPMRIINSPIGQAIPAVDFADNIGYTRSAITNIISKHPDLFKGFILKITLPTPGGDQDFLCLNSTGIDRIIFHLRPIKNRPDLCERIEKFRSKAFGQLAERKELTISVPAIPGILFELKQAREEADICGCEPNLLQAAVYRKHGEIEKADALQPPAPALVHGSTGWFIPTQLGDMCGLTAEQFNHWIHNNPNDLERRPFQCRDPENRKIWRLTELGRMHGQEYWFEAPSGHREIRIRWRESILYASGLKRELPRSQMALPAKAGA